MLAGLDLPGSPDGVAPKSGGFISCIQLERAQRKCLEVIR